MFGPIAALELTHRAQRLRHRVIVVVYVTLLLLAMSINYLITLLFASTGQGFASSSMASSAAFASSFFLTFTYSQLIVVLLLTPAYTAGAIAIEKERHTLEFLLTTDLGAWEIVLGRFAVRFLQIVFVELAGMPVLAFAAWLGGISLEHMLMAFVLCAAWTASLAGLSVLMSVITTRVRDAVLGTYLLAITFCWLLPALLEFTRGQLAPRFDWLQYVENVLWDHPLAALGRVFETTESGSVWGVAGSAIRNHTLFGIAAVLASGFMMRPIYLRQRFGPTKQRRARRAAKRRPVPDDPVYWREQVGTRPGVLGRMGQFVVILGSLGLVLTTAVMATMAVVESGSIVVVGAAEGLLIDLHMLLKVWGTVMGSLILLAIAIRAATVITGEREAQTLDALLVTPLAGWEILKGKVLGCLWAVRWPTGALAASWLIASAVGAISPLAVVALAIEMGVYGVFAAAVGVHCSLRSRGSGGALAMAIGTMLFVAGGFFATCIPALFWFFFMNLSPPISLSMTCVRSFDLSGNSMAWFLTSYVAIETAAWLALYAVASGLLVSAAVRGFDRHVGRAWLSVSEMAMLQAYNERMRARLPLTEKAPAALIDPGTLAAATGSFDDRHDGA